MNERIKTNLRNCVRQAIREGNYFKDEDELVDYVTSCGFSEDVVRSDVNWVLRVCLSEQAVARDSSLPSPARSSHQLAGDHCLEAEESIEKEDLEPVRFSSDVS